MTAPGLVAGELVRIYRELSRAVATLNFGPPVTHVYNPLDYARDPAEQYLERAARREPEALFLGMNPGPWGMAQTGVPFGSIPLVRDWLGIEGPVGKPEPEHPRRKVEGFAVRREEVSGNRFWGWARERFGTADRFFSRFFVANYCPLVFMEETGRNRTPDKLPAAEQSALFGACDRALREVVGVLRPHRVVAIGAFAEKRAAAALAGQGLPIGRILHPSPASPVANRGWAPQAEQQLRELGIAI
ncbi:MAG: single-stranded DNA-binding protein [Gammaproteobacteria bacterium]|nr:single-stranded DNA-binding protein [Gammaproteobacteria bacterium]